MNRLPAIAVGLLAAAALPAQEPAWSVYGPAGFDYLWICPFGDFNGDGQSDVLVALIVHSVPNLSWPHQSLPHIGIRSGADGSMFWQEQIYFTRLHQGGDFDGDGINEFLIMQFTAAYGPGWVLLNGLQVYSPAKKQVLWTVFGPHATQYAFDSLGNLDTDGDGKPNVVTISRGRFVAGIWSLGYVYVYDWRGQELYRVDMTALGFEPLSLGAMGDLDGDGADDFLVGCGDPPLMRGTVHVLSGRTGAILLTAHGLQAGDKTCDKVRSVGDVDGDGVEDFAGFPWWSAWRDSSLVWSGATGAVIHAIATWPEAVITTEDFDRDGIRDILSTTRYGVSPPQVYGITFVHSGRDATELWRVQNFYGSGTSSWWATSAASLGVPPNGGYPRIAWCESDHYPWPNHLPWAQGRVRAFDTVRLGQGPLLGRPCSSTGTYPMIGARSTSSGARVTIARGPSGAYAWLNLALGNPVQHAGVALPMALDPFGLIGCMLRVGPEVSVFRQLGTTGIDRGYAAVDLPVQLAATLGTIAQAQWLVYDPQTGAYGATEQHQLRLQ